MTSQGSVTTLTNFALNADFELGQSSLCAGNQITIPAMADQAYTIQVSSTPVLSIALETPTQTNAAYGCIITETLEYQDSLGAWIPTLPAAFATLASTYQLDI